MMLVSLAIRASLVVLSITAFCLIYNTFFHPLAKFPGPWYAAASSLPLAVISLLKREPQYLLRITCKYGHGGNIAPPPPPPPLGDKPIRIAPTLLLSPKSAHIKDIYWDANHNTESGLYNTVMLGHPPNIFTIDGNEHRALRKALGGPHQKSDLISLFIAKMTRLCFGETWGFVEKLIDERGILRSFRDGLVLFGFVGRWRGFRETLMVEARVDGEPLSPIRRRAHVTILVMVGADTTGTALSSTPNYMLTHPECLKKARAEVDEADKRGLLSNPAQYEETKAHLPYMAASTKEGGLLLRPPATNLFGRVAGKGGAKVGSVWVPEMEMTSNAYVVQRDPELFAPDPESFRPERWLESEEKSARMETAKLVFGVGPRVCLDKGTAVPELYKLFPEIIRRYLVGGGVAYNKDLLVNLRLRDEEWYLESLAFKQALSSMSAVFAS
ncbi:cytochrome P450 [Immersiella caudata]|uniref:Cytochrome P450 n=1 Tax=Immersiella caudata TaxID=314043 RepID=A0AA40BV35_9PEZI|nr:cytochrome P450 [Immersiella caudata]